MFRGRTGEYVTLSTVGETCRAFVPHPLPPRPPLVWSNELIAQLNAANIALGRLDGISAILPNRDLFLYSYIRKEAVLSSKIEGTQSSFSDLLLYETESAAGAPLHADVQEVSNYVAALNHGLARLKEGFPLSLRLIKELHAKLSSKGRGHTQMPGEFRRSQNWISGSRPGNARFVPPPADRLPEALSILEAFLHDEAEKTPTLVKAALVHLQFETIHPFLDGNGRVGRLLITLLLSAENAVSEPLLYLSLYLKRNRARYYELLQKTREEGDWEEWLAFFFIGVAEIGNQAVASVKQALQLFAEDRARIQTLGRAAFSALELHRFFQMRPIGTIAQARASVAISVPTLNASVQHLVQLGILEELSGRSRYRIYSYKRYLDLLSADDDA